MLKYQLIDIDIFMIIILIMIIAVIQLKQTFKSVTTRIFLLLCWSVIVLLVLDALPWIMDGLPGQSSRTFLFLFNFILILSGPVPLVLWLCYIDYQLNHSKIRLKKRLFYLYPLILTGIILIYSVFTGFIFYIDSDNNYQRGPGIFLVAFIQLLTLIYSYFLVIENRKAVSKDIIRGVALFGILPVTGTVLQMRFYGTTIIWPSVALAVTFVYIFLEIQREIRDYLTGLLNRQQIDEYIQLRIKDYERKGSFTLVMMDMDGFKEINDDYGHSEGDAVLVQTAALLNSSIKRMDRAARFGGDEFMLLLETNAPSEIHAVIQRIYDKISEVSTKNKKPYKISLSAGYIIYSPDKHRSFHEFLHAADQNMYIAKRERRQQGTYGK